MTYPGGSVDARASVHLPWRPGVEWESVMQHLRNHRLPASLHRHAAVTVGSPGADAPDSCGGKAVS
ncbi:hypothetical protein MIPYR_30255 [uncultured Microbacterium sp.]|uniref:Uncharacterized protein n=1 Tax=uncultured Microbacterium sp. TaxID=191216 RepID=A0A1Y5P2F2_9MICO|nr:hypothetical protein MIPYR_30255 [uncultured Microbacterium sp.]